ncbi:hypothetical protein ABK040_009831 [Willaertia magna]
MSNFTLPLELITQIQTFLSNNEKQVTRYINSEWNISYFHSVTQITLKKRFTTREQCILFLKQFYNLNYIYGNIDLLLEHLIQLKNNLSHKLKHLDSLHLDNLTECFELIKNFPNYETIKIFNNYFRHSDKLEIQLSDFIINFMKNTIKRIHLQNVYLTNKQFLELFKNCNQLQYLYLQSDLDMKFQDNFNLRPDHRLSEFNLSSFPINKLKELSIIGNYFIVNSLESCLERNSESLEHLTLQCNFNIMNICLLKLSKLNLFQLKYLKLICHDFPNDDNTLQPIICNLFINIPNLEHLTITKVLKEKECEFLIENCKFLKKVEVDGLENDNCFYLCENVLY